MRGRKRDFKFGEGIGQNPVILREVGGKRKTAVSPLNILLVDDDRNLVTTLSYGLRKAMGEGISVAICFSGSEALSMLATQAVDVVVSDFNMPGLSGLEFLHTIRQDYRDMILVLITAYGTDALEEEVRQLGAGYITKPFEPSFLVQLLKDLIQGEKTKSRTENATRITEKLGRPSGSSQGVRLQGRLYE